MNRAQRRAQERRKAKEDKANRAAAERMLCSDMRRETSSI